MRIISDLTKKEYSTVEECEQAEKEFLEAKRVEEEKKKELAEQRKVRATEVEDAMKAIKDAEDHYYELLNAFIKDYGSYHYSSRSVDDVPVKSMFSLFKPFEDFFFKF